MEDRKSKFLTASELVMQVDYPEDSVLFILNGQSQAQWTCYDNVGPVKFREQANTFPRQFQAYSKVVVTIPLESFEMVAGICIGFCGGKFIHGTLRKPKLLAETGYIFYLKKGRRCMSDDGF